jgi:hypothetical protein
MLSTNLIHLRKEVLDAIFVFYIVQDDEPLSAGGDEGGDEPEVKEPQGVVRLPISYTLTTR